MQKEVEAGNSGRTGIRRWIRFGMVLSLAMAFGLSAPAPGRASDVEELCRMKLDFYLKTIDVFLEQDARPRQRYRLMPYMELNKAIAPLEGCTIEEVKAAVARSRFAQPAYNQNRDVWVFKLSNGRIEIGFGYRADRKKSDLHHAGWTRKFL